MPVPRPPEEDWVDAPLTEEKGWEDAPLPVEVGEWEDAPLAVPAAPVKKSRGGKMLDLALVGGLTNPVTLPLSATIGLFRSGQNVDELLTQGILNVGKMGVRAAQGLPRAVQETNPLGNLPWAADSPERINAQLTAYEKALDPAAAGIQEVSDAMQMDVPRPQGTFTQRFAQAPLQETVESAALNAPNLLATLGAGAAGGPLAAGAVGGLLEGGSTYDTLREAGVEPSVASRNALVAGGVKSVLESYGPNKLLKALRETGAPAKNVLMELGKGFLNEGIPEGLQEVTDILAEMQAGVYKGDGWDAVQRVLENVYAGGVMGGAGGTVVGVRSQMQAPPPAATDTTVEPTRSSEAGIESGVVETTAGLTAYNDAAHQRLLDAGFSEEQIASGHIAIKAPDNLTGLPKGQVQPESELSASNGWSVTVAAGEQFHKATGKPLQIASVDINNLKGVNDSQGHPAGNEYKAKAAQLLESAIREVDPSAHVTLVGGDEIAVVSQASREDLALAMEKARTQIVEFGKSKGWGEIANPRSPSDLTMLGTGIKYGIDSWHPGEKASKAYQLADLWTTEDGRRGNVLSQAAGAERAGRPEGRPGEVAPGNAAENRGAGSGNGPTTASTPAAAPEVEQTTALPPEPANGPGAASAAEFKAKKQFVTDARHATIDAEREVMGLPPIIPQLKHTWGQAFEDAKAKMEEDSQYAQRLFSEMKQNPRPPSDTESAALLIHQADLQNNVNKASADLLDASSRQDADAVKDAMGRLSFYGSEYNALREVTRDLGSEKGRTLNAQKMMVREDYSLARLTADKIVENEGKPLTKKQVEEVQKTVKDLEDAAAKADAEVEQSEKRGRKRQLDKTTKNLVEQDAKERKREAKKGEVRDLAAEEVNIVEAIRNKVRDELPMTSWAQLVRKLAGVYVRKGLNDPHQLALAVHGALRNMVPNLEFRQTMDAISGYGEFKPLDKTPWKQVLRDMKAQLLQWGKLQDMWYKQAPLRTGMEMGEATEAQRELIKKVNEAKKKGGFDVTDPAKALKTALDALHTRLTNSIRDVEMEIATMKRVVRGQNKLAYDLEAKKLKERLDELRAQRDALLPRPGLTDAQRKNIALAAAAKSVAEWNRRIAEKDFGPRTRETKRVDDVELAWALAERDAAKMEWEALRDAASPKLSPEEMALSALKARQAREIAEYTRKLAENDYSVREYSQPVLDKEAFEAQQKLDGLKEQVREKRLVAERKALPPTQKVRYALGSFLDNLKTMKASFDDSVLGRQGWWLSLAHPIYALKAKKAGWGAAFSEHEVYKREQAILAHPLYKKMVEAKLYLSPTAKGRTETRSAEEAYYGGALAEKYMPGVRLSERLYTVQLNELRIKAFQNIYNASRGGVTARVLEKVPGVRSRGELSGDELQAIGNYINLATGRGNLGSMAQAANALSKVFWSPRLVASRFQIGLGTPLYAAYRSSPRVGSAIAQEYLRSMAGLGTIIGLALGAGAEVEDDPRSTDFGKIKFGNIRVDITGGIASSWVILSKILLGSKKSNGKVVTLRGDKAAYGKSVFDELTRYARYKMNPGAAMVLNLLDQKDAIGKPYGPENIPQEFIPLSPSDAVTGLIKYGLSKEAALLTLSLFGLGVQDYDANAKKDAKPLFGSEEDKNKGAKPLY